MSLSAEAEEDRAEIGDADDPLDRQPGSDLGLRVAGVLEDLAARRAGPAARLRV